VGAMNLLASTAVRAVTMVGLSPPSHDIDLGGLGGGPDRQQGTSNVSGRAQHIRRLWGHDRQTPARPVQCLNAQAKHLTLFVCLPHTSAHMLEQVEDATQPGCTPPPRPAPNPSTPATHMLCPRLKPVVRTDAG
jgi:hypothetical protein